VSLKKHGVIHVEWIVSDREAAAHFFKELFDWDSTQYPDQRYSTVDLGEISAGLTDTPDALGSPGQVLIYVASEDVAADLERAEALGGEIVVPRTLIPGLGWMGIFADPAGNHIGLLKLDS
jgi:uncharacterized protein